ncbi:hypothetical protein CVT24_000319, partial [Panaeolus cyanescens]
MLNYVGYNRTHTLLAPPPPHAPPPPGLCCYIHLSLFAPPAYVSYLVAYSTGQAKLEPVREVMIIKETPAPAICIPSDDGHSRISAPDADTSPSPSRSPSTPPSTKPISLHTLTLDYVNFTSLSTSLLSSSSSQTLFDVTTLKELRVAHFHDPAAIEQLLKSCGPSLECLHLKPGSWR